MALALQLVEGAATRQDIGAVFLEGLARAGGVVLVLLRVGDRDMGDPVSLWQSLNSLKLRAL